MIGLLVLAAVAVSPLQDKAERMMVCRESLNDFATTGRRDYLDRHAKAVKMPAKELTTLRLTCDGYVAGYVDGLEANQETAMDGDNGK